MELIRVEMVWRSHGDRAEPVIDPGVPETLFMIRSAVCHTSPRPGSRRRQAALILARGWPAFAVKASQRRGIPVVPRHTSIKQKGLAVSWLTHCRNRLSRHWTIRSRS